MHGDGGNLYPTRLGYHGDMPSLLAAGAQGHDATRYHGLLPR